MAAVVSSNNSSPDFSSTRIEADENVLDPTLDHDPELQAIATRLDSDVSIDADRDLNVDPSETVPRDSDSASNSSSLKDTDDNIFDDKSDDDSNGSPVINGEVRDSREKKDVVKSANGSAKNSHKPDKEEKSKKDEKSRKDEKSGKDSRRSSKGSLAKGAGASDTDSTTSGKKGCSPPAKKNPLRMLKKLTKFDKSSKKTDYKSEFTAVVVDKLPQVFVVKYLGHKQVGGVCGLHHVRKPVDEMVGAVRSKLDQSVPAELPLLYVVVTPKGLDLREHKNNKVKDTAPLGMMPIDFISYGVQDIKYWRVFTCIVVRELSSRSRTATCHAFLCDSSHNGRKMALALGAAFSVYNKRLRAHGKVHNFQVELRPPDELADTMEDYEA